LKWIERTRDANLRQQERGRRLKIGGQPILRFGALCNKRPEKRGHSFLQTMAPIQATGGVTPVAALYQNSVGAFSLWPD
jgi:hypothetical protein